MADKAKGKKKKKAKKAPRKPGLGFSERITMIAGILLAVAFLQTTVVLAVGMLPTIVAYFVGRAKKGTLAITIGAMNIAGCTPFLIDIWTLGHNFDDAIDTLSNPKTIIIMYSAAAIGYLINWSTSSVVQSLMVKNSETRLVDIDKRKVHLEERWGKEVSGDYPVDSFGFAVEEPDNDG